MSEDGEPPMNEVEAIKDLKKLEKMKKYLHEKSLRNYALFVLGINSGLRISDLLALKVCDVFDQTGHLRDRITLKEQKTGKNKDFPISDTAKKALKEYIGSVTLQDDDILFRSRKGGKLDRSQVYKILNEAALVAGISGKIGTHTLRKTFGYQAYTQCGSLSLVMKLLNHRSQEDTLRYIGITKQECDDVYLNLNL